MSSKRKSLSQSIQVMSSDIHFEDDDDHNSVAGDSAKGSQKGSRGGSRISNRAKKAKAIYDPSEHNGPVHKRKKEALEKETEKLKSPVKHTTGSSPKQTPEAIKPRTSVSSESSKSKAPVKTTPEKKIRVVMETSERPRVMVPSRYPETLKRAMAKPIISAFKKEVVPIPPLVIAKAPSKRIQARKQIKVQNNTEKPVKKQRLESSSTTTTEDYDKASTVEMKHQNIPDVRNWSFLRVYEYFSNNLGFKPEDAVVFKDEEIDGEALMIMKRSDIVNTKFQTLKLGVALKMWTFIIQFQTGSNDPTQAWK